MVALDTQPTNSNYLNPLGFRFMVKKLPNVNYFCQTVTLPSVSIESIQSATPLGSLYYPGGKVVYDQLSVSFKVDEDLNNYKEIHNWIIGLGHPKTLDQYKNLSISSEVPNKKVGTAASVTSDGSLIILTSHKNANHSIKFIDLFPMMLSEIQFDSTQSNVEYLQATAQFRYLRYEIEKL